MNPLLTSHCPQSFAEAIETITPAFLLSGPCASLFPLSAPVPPHRPYDCQDVPFNILPEEGEFLDTVQLYGDLFGGNAALLDCGFEDGISQSSASIDSLLDPSLSYLEPSANGSGSGFTSAAAKHACQLSHTKPKPWPERSFHINQPFQAFTNHETAEPTRTILPESPSLTGAFEDVRGSTGRTASRKPSSIPGTSVFCLSDGRRANKRKRNRHWEDLGHTRSSDLPRHKIGAGAACVRCRVLHERCSGSFPCKTCKELKVWPEICSRVSFADNACFDKGLYCKRYGILHNNVDKWLLATDHPLVTIKVSVGLKPTLLLQLSTFVPMNENLLCHVNFRSSSRSFLKTTRTEPFGLWAFQLRDKFLDEFLDAMIPDVLAGLENYENKVWNVVFEHAIKYSKEPSRADANMLTKLLRMWIGHGVYFDRLWRITGNGRGVGAQFHSGLNAFDCPRMLYWQLDCAMEDYLQRLERAVLHDLEKFILSRKKDTWLSAFVGSFIYLAILERESWNLETWRSKMKSWADHPAISVNPTMRWPLRERPDEFVRRNEHNARVIAHHLRAVNKASYPFVKREDGSLAATQFAEDREVEAFAAALNMDYPALRQRLMFTHETKYREHDFHSLDYIYLRMLFHN